ncbi:calcineurin B homologous protein 1 [Drosophila madeirensis]|uniref:Calcineurin B homologous protein 1 n=1 Tax=Drosophila madeirensis TaxID=30013 RepID=A0AAU9FXR9_DROMD
MGLNCSRSLSPKQMEEHQRETGLSCAQLEQLYRRFQSLDRQRRGYLTPTDMLRIPQLAQHPLKRQIVDTFFPRRCGTATLSFDQFVCACATVLEPQFIFTKTMEYHGPPDNERADKMRLLCKMIDTQNLGYILIEDFRKFMGTQLDQNVGHRAELPLLEKQAFGLNHSALGQIKYNEFECRLSAADLEGRLSIRKWLGKDVPSRIGTRLCAEPGAHAIHHK